MSNKKTAASSCSLLLRCCTHTHTAANHSFCTKKNEGHVRGIEHGVVSLGFDGLPDLTDLHLPAQATSTSDLRAQNALSVRDVGVALFWVLFGGGLAKVPEFLGCHEEELLAHRIIGKQEELLGSK